VAGKVMVDVLRLADPPIVVPDQGLGLAEENSADFASASCDGIFVRARCSTLSSKTARIVYLESTPFEATCAPVLPGCMLPMEWHV
jgi:hypothetical protein